MGLLTALVVETKAAIYSRALDVARGLDIPVDSWVVGDPTRSLYHVLSEILETLEMNVAGFFASAFLDYSQGDWLEVVAFQVYGVSKVKATYAAVPVTLTNGGGGLFVIEPGDVVIKSSVNRKTYTNTSGGTLASGPATTLALDFTADESGSDSSAGAGEIDTLVTNYPLVTCSNALAAVGLDDESDPALRVRCRAKLGMLSPNGPRDAYDFVVRDATRTGVSEITRSRTIADSVLGNVTTYVAGASGAVSGGAVTAAQSAVVTWSAPLCITPTVTNASGVTVPVAYTLWLYDSVGETAPTIQANVQTALEALFANKPIGGDIIAPATTGALYRSHIEAAILAVYAAHAFRVSVTSPAGDTALAINEVAALGTVTPTVNLEAAP